MTTELSDLISAAIINWRGDAAYLSRSADLRSVLNTLEPSAPEDGEPGFIAYNTAPGKPRMKMKIGRFLTRKLALNSDFLTDAEIRTLAEQLDAYLFPHGAEFRLDTGERIRLNYTNNIGCESCMCGSASDCVGLYVDNPSRFAQLICHFAGDTGRAIVHTLDNGQRLLERTYASSDAIASKMRDYAWSQGWLVARCGLVYSAEDAQITDYHTLIVSGLSWTDGELPYQDTLTHYHINRRTGKMDIFHPGVNASTDGELIRTDGLLVEAKHCANCGRLIDDYGCFSVNDDTYCEQCAADLFVCCDRCCEYIPQDDAISVNSGDLTYCEYCADHYTYQCADCTGYCTELRTVTLNGVSENVCTGCIEDHYTTCANCSRIIDNDEMTGDTCVYCLENSEPDEVEKFVRLLDVANIPNLPGL